MKREQKLQQIVHLIGEDALPDTDRILLVCCDMIKQGFLQQNSFDDMDMFSAPHKAIMIITTIVSFYHRSFSLIKSGCPLYKVMNMNVKEEIIRMKSKYANDDIDGMKSLNKKMTDEFDELAKMYRKFE